MALSIKRTAAVTGARGLVGRSIIKHLLDKGWQVRALTRSNISYDDPRVQVIKSDINSEKGIKSLLSGVEAIFHCAGEVSDEKKMHITNVEGTRILLSIAKESRAFHFCHISSAGVVGPTKDRIVNEKTCCNPKSLYERTKYESEQLVLNANLKMNITILRPTNVVSAEKLGVFLLLPIRNSWQDKLKVFITGREGAHIVHVDNVAEAALYSLDNKVLETNVYFISSDSDKLNTVSGIYNSYLSICRNKKYKIRFSLPMLIPYLIRKIYKGNSLHGQVQFSSDKIKNKGFIFKYSIEDSLRNIYTQTDKNI